jgi:hypothetical protein
MANVYTIGGPNGNFADLNSIDSAALAEANNTFQITPGEYTAPNDFTGTDISFQGLGDRDDVIIIGNSSVGFSVANTYAGALTFENLTIKGQDSVATGDPAGSNTCVTKLGATASPMIFRNVKFTNAVHAANSHAEFATSAGVDTVEMHYCQANVDKAIVSNANVYATYSLFGANAYHTAEAGDPALVIKTLLCGPNTANVGNSTETIQATIA